MSLHRSQPGGFALSNTVTHRGVPLHVSNGYRDSYINFDAGGNTNLYQPGCTGMNLLSSLKSGNGGLYVGNNQGGARKDIFPVNGQRRY